MGADPQAFRAARAALLDEAMPRGAVRRRALTALTDAWLAEVFVASGAEDCALLAVGGYGRGELAPGSDLDLLLLVGDTSERKSEQVANRIWYPAWDSGVRIDHSVRTVARTRRMAAHDMKVVLGLLDSRCVAGDAALAERVKSSVLGDWRAMATKRMGELRQSAEERRARFGELAHLLEPDIKEAYGGLRDVTLLRAISASWLTDVAHGGMDQAREDLLDIRDALHAELMASGRRPNDVLLLQDQSAVAARLGRETSDQLLRDLSTCARRVALAADTAWHRVEQSARGSAVARGSRGIAGSVGRRLRRSGPARYPLADGVVVADREVVLAVDARPDRDAVLVLRLAAAAAQARMPIGSVTIERLARESMALAQPWSLEAREAFVSLLGSGVGLVGTWEHLDQAGIISRLLPEWDAVRSAPQRNPVHVYRVDRHLIETAVQASSRVRDVDRPDLLLAGALMHDIGKGRERDHTLVGEELVERIAPRMGFDEADTEILVRLVRYHLLLPEVATRRDLDDPATVAMVADAVRDRRFLDLLHALTESDALATGPAAWSDWKRDLVNDLVRRVAATLAGVEPPAAPSLAGRYRELIDGAGTQVRMEVGHPASTVVVVADDRPGLLATLAGTLALLRLEVKSADTETVGHRAVTEWRVVPMFGEPPTFDRLGSDVRRALAGDLDVAARMARREQPKAQVPARVSFVSAATSHADVVEVRAHDEPGLLHRMTGALASAGAFVTAARVSTLGSEAVDVFYLRRADGGRLTVEDRAAVVATVLDALADRPD